MEHNSPLLAVLLTLDICQHLIKAHLYLQDVCAMKTMCACAFVSVCVCVAHL